MSPTHHSVTTAKTQRVGSSSPLSQRRCLHARVSTQCGTTLPRSTQRTRTCCPSSPPARPHPPSFPFAASHCVSSHPCMPKGRTVPPLSFRASSTWASHPVRQHLQQNTTRMTTMKMKMTSSRRRAPHHPLIRKIAPHHPLIRKIAPSTPPRPPVPSSSYSYGYFSHRASSLLPLWRLTLSLAESSVMI